MTGTDLEDFDGYTDPNEPRFDSPPQTSKTPRKTLIIGFIGILCIVGAVIGIAVGITRPQITPSKQEEQTNPPSSETRFPTTPSPAPTTTRHKEIKSNVLTALSGIDGIELSSFDDPNSPQSQSIDWIVNIDKANISSADENLLQRFLMANLWFNLGGTSWSRNELWLSTNSTCEWSGVKCVDVGDGIEKVTVINLENNAVGGELPLEIGAFKNLENLMLARNGIGGSIPRTIGNLKKIRKIELWDNNLTGRIPTTIGMMDSLSEIYFSDNELTGVIPTELGNLSNLRDIELQNNLLASPIPDQVSNLSSLWRFWASNNTFDGNIPTTPFSGLPNFEKLYLDRNRFAGSIPSELATTISKINDIRLNGNELTGCPPEQLFQMSTLRILYLDKNQLLCDLSPSIYSAPVLEDLQIFGNNFYGTLPEVSGQSVLRVLELSNNRLNGPIPASYGNLVNIVNLKFHGNDFNESVPVELGSLINLKNMTLHNNSLTGNVPTEVCDLFAQNLRNLTADCEEPNPKITCSCCTSCFS